MDNSKSIYALLLAAAVLVGGSIWFACSSTETWLKPTTWEETVFCIPDSLLTKEQEQLKHNFETYIHSEGIVKYVDGKKVVTNDLNKMKSLGIPIEYANLYRDKAENDPYLKEEYDSFVQDVQQRMDRGEIVIYDGGSGVTFAKNDSMAQELLRKNPKAHIYEGSLIHLYDSIGTEAHVNH